MKELQLFKKDGVTVVSSRVVANDFEKDHSKVIRKIEEKLADPKMASLNWFIENEYSDAQNKPRKEYLLTRDGFSFIVMGFTGSKADEFKIKYIEAFNQMELTIQQIATDPMSIMRTQFQVLEKHDEKIIHLENEVTDLRDNLPFLPLECDAVSAEVRRRGVLLLEGKESSAYQDNSLRGKVYSALYKQLKTEFNVSSYKAIKRKNYEIAIGLVKDLQLPYHLREKVEQVNGQMDLGIEVA